MNRDKVLRIIKDGRESDERAEAERRDSSNEFLKLSADAAVVMEAVNDLRDDLGLDVRKNRCEPGLPEIPVNRIHLRDRTERALEAIGKANAANPCIFTRGGALVRMHTREAEPKFELFNQNSLRGYVDRIADFVRCTKEETLPADPPPNTVWDLLTLSSYDNIPKLIAVESTPFFAANGELVIEAGYHADSQTFLHLDGLQVPAIPDRPTPEDIAAAKVWLLDELLVDFPFVDDASRAYAIALLVYGFMRQMVNAIAPLHAFDAPTEGTGKGLLASALALIVSGQPLTNVTEAKDGDEIRKQITSLLIAGASLATFDNIHRKLSSGNLASLLTADVWTDRILGGNKTVNLQNRTVWMVSGNNLRFSRELARRTIRIRLDAQLEHPSLRTREDFRHPDLLAWVRENRGQLIAVTLTIIRHWIAVGQPPFTEHTLGSFEAWGRTVGGVLEAAGIPGFLKNREAFQAAADDTKAPWLAFVEAWAEKFGDGPAGVGSLFPLALELLPGITADDRPNRTRLGSYLASRRDTVISGWKIVFADVKDDAGRSRAGWQLIRPIPYTRPANSGGTPHPGWEVGEPTDSLMKSSTCTPQPRSNEKSEVGDPNPAKTKKNLPIPQPPNLQVGLVEISGKEDF